MIKDEHFEVVGVVTQPDRPAGRKMQLQPSPVKSLAAPLGIPIFTPESINTDEVLAQLAALHAEVVVVVAFGQILKKPFLALFPDKVVNVHASVLPRWRGAAPIQRALMAGDKETGVCLQVMVRKLDAGPVLGARRFPLTEDMNAFDSYRQCEVLGAELIKVDLMDYLRGNLTAIPQDESQVTYAAKIDKAEARLDWSKDALELHNRVRGLAMGPQAYAVMNGKMLKLHRTRPHSAPTVLMRPGQVVQVTEKSLLVSCGTGSLELLEVQPESRAKIQIDEYLRGYPVKAGDTFDVHTAERKDGSNSRKSPAQDGKKVR
jgi:methionyl-tRNA formyltransferase